MGYFDFLLQLLDLILHVPNVVLVLVLRRGELFPQLCVLLDEGASIEASFHHFSEPLNAFKFIICCNQLLFEFQVFFSQLRQMSLLQIPFDAACLLSCPEVFDPKH